MKKKLLKLTTIILICVMLLGNITAFASGAMEQLKGIGIAPDSFTDAVKDEVITRGEYAYIMAGLMTTEKQEPKNTRFTDVTVADYYSGAVEYLAQNAVAGGYGDGTFGKDDPLTLETAYIFLMRVLGYESFVIGRGEASNSYTNFAYMLGLGRGSYTNIEGYVTKNGAAKMAYDALTLSLPSVYYSEDGGELIVGSENSGKGNVLSERLKISVYKGVVTNVDVADNHISFKATSNAFLTNPVIMNSGEEKTFSADSSIDIYEYDNTPVTIWVNEDETVIYISIDDKVEVRYANIYSVNGDKNKANAYLVGGISQIMFYDDEEEYTVADNATFKVNGENFAGRYAFAGKYARVVLCDGEITHIESWDLIEGGIVDEIADEQIKYTKGNMSMILRGLDKCSTKMYFVNGKNTDKSELKMGSVFYYYKNEQKGYLVIVASDQLITANFESMTDSGLQIGNVLLAHEDTFYYRTDLDGYYKQYGLSGNFASLYGQRVSAYLAPSGKILYLSVAGEQAVSNEFYGVVMGVEQDIYDDEAEVRVYVLKEEVTEELYKITEKTIYKDGISIPELSANSAKLDGSGVYKFRINQKGEIREISHPQDFYGFNGPAIATTTGQILGSSGSVQMSINSKSVRFPDVGLYAIYELGGELKIKYIKWADIAGQYMWGNQIRFRLYGEDVSSIPNLVILTGALEYIGAGGAIGKMGFITKKHHRVNEDGETMCAVTVMSQSGEAVYTVTKEYGDTLSVDTFILYKETSLFSENDIVVRKKWDVSGDVDTWDDTSSTYKMKRGVVKYADERRIVFDDGNASCYYTTVNILSVDVSGTKRVYGTGSKMDLSSGDTVFYAEDTEGIKLMITIKQ